MIILHANISSNTNMDENWKKTKDNSSCSIQTQNRKYRNKKITRELTAHKFINDNKS